MVRIYPARTYEEEIANLDVSTLRGGADVDSLSFPAGVQFIVRDGVVFERVWRVSLELPNTDGYTPYTIPFSLA